MSDLPQKALDERLSMMIALDAQTKAGGDHELKQHERDI